MTDPCGRRPAGPAAVLAALLAVLALAGCGPAPPAGEIGGSVAEDDTGNATLERIVDGDTIIVDVGGTRERVRLLGIDTPESVAENRPVECYGPDASAYLTALLEPGAELQLIRDIEPRDQYDRLLAYVVRIEDELFVNLDLVEKGYADALSYAPNLAYADAFEDAARRAAADGVGLWGACGGPDVPLG